MLRKLYIDGGFTHQDKTFVFDEGLTGIIGPNESGKSLIVEFIRYALFGSKALRGKAEDYKNLHVELDFTVAGEDYTVVRKKGKAELTGIRSASGTRPVDEAIQSILGYDLTVFDVANACNQGNIEALSDMTPANRKAMVDKTVGLTGLDDLIKHCGAEGNTLKREAAALQSGLVEPVEPVKGDFRTVEELRPLAAAAAEDQTEYNQLVGWLSHSPSKPAKPKPIKIKETSTELSALIDHRKTLQRSIANLKANRDNHTPEMFSAEELDKIEAQWDAYDAWTQKQRLLAQGHICCPECGHEWPVADLTGLEKVKETVIPGITRKQLAEHRSRLGNDEKIAGFNQAISELEDQLDTTPDRTADLTEVEQYESLVQVYERNLKAYETYAADAPAKQARKEELEGIGERVAALTEELTLARAYEQDLARYERDLLVYEENMARAQQLSQKSEDYLKAREIIQALKTSVKSHLLPSLNKVASMLLTQMTGGERYDVQIDDEFEIMIDGQPLATLSGSGKAVANLAIRIALGQILTNRVFSIFMADEVDAAMDDDRAAYTAEALRRLTEHVRQVILVTHKRPETDHTFELKK